MDSELLILVENLHKSQRDGDENDKIEAFMNLAQYHYNKQDFAKATISLKQIKQINPKTPNVNYYLSLIELSNENIEKAINYLNLELNINPENINAKNLKDKLKIHSNFPLVTLFLFLINLGVYLLTFPKITMMDSVRYGVSRVGFDIWSIITSGFFHMNLFHFIVNMVILLMFGLILEKNIGSLKFLLIYLLSGMIGNLIQAIVFNESIVLGASASLFGVLGALMMRQPLLDIKLFGIIKTPLILVLGGFFTLSAIVGIFIKTQVVSGDIAHVSGLFIGMLITAIYYRETINVFYNWLFIAFGFWLIEFALKTYVLADITLLSELLFLIFSFIMGIGIIVYSYQSLKLAEGIRT